MEAYKVHSWAKKKEVKVKGNGKKEREGLKEVTI